MTFIVELSVWIVYLSIALAGFITLVRMMRMHQKQAAAEKRVPTWILLFEFYIYPFLLWPFFAVALWGTGLVMRDSTSLSAGDVRQLLLFWAPAAYAATWPFILYFARAIRRRWLLALFHYSPIIFLPFLIGIFAFPDLIWNWEYPQHSLLVIGLCFLLPVLLAISIHFSIAPAKEP